MEPSTKSATLHLDRSRAGGLLGAWLALAGVAGCGDDAAERVCDYEVCAVDDPACVERVAVAVGCHLEQETLYPKVRRLTAAEYLAEWDDGPAPTAEEQRDSEDYLRMQALVGLMPAGYMAEEASADYLRNFAAFYSSERKEIILLTDRAASDLQGDYVILVHEMVHAYHDAAWDFAALHEEHAPTFDRFLGLRALIEGFAVLYQNFAYVELDGYDPVEIDWYSFFAEWQDDRLQRAAETETPALDILAYFPYAFGGELLLNAWQDGGRARIDDLSTTPPESVRQVLLGYLAWAGQVRNEDAAFDPQAVAVMPANYTLVNGGHESVWSLNAMVQRTAGGGLWSSALDQVSAEFLAAWRRDDREVVAMWRIRSDAPDDLIAALQRPGSIWAPAGMPTTHLVTTVDTDVLLIAVSSGDANTVLAEIEGWQAPSEAFADSEAGAPRRFRGFDPRRLGCAPLRRW